MRRQLGLGLLYAADCLVIAGSMYDLFVPTVPANLLAYQGVMQATIDPRVAALDLGLLRALGGCLLAIGATALVLVHGPIRRGERWAMLALVLLVGVSEGINSYQMALFGSPFYAPLTFVGLTLSGVSLVWSASRGANDRVRSALAPGTASLPTLGAKTAFVGSAAYLGTPPESVTTTAGIVGFCDSHRFTAHWG
jgi:hypothetical protein